MITFIVGFVLGVVASYLFLRNNPNIRAKADQATDEVKSKLGK